MIVLLNFSKETRYQKLYTSILYSTLGHSEVDSGQILNFCNFAILENVLKFLKIFEFTKKI